VDLLAKDLDLFAAGRLRPSLRRSKKKQRNADCVAFH
jgi:hypothetical protein